MNALPKEALHGLPVCHVSCIRKHAARYCSQVCQNVCRQQRDSRAAVPAVLRRAGIEEDSEGMSVSNPGRPLQ